MVVDSAEQETAVLVSHKELKLVFEGWEGGLPEVGAFRLIAEG